MERLRELHPTYRSWSSQDLAAMLRRYDLHRAKSNGQGVIRKTAVEAALESLREDDSDDDTAPDSDEPEDS